MFLRPELCVNPSIHIITHESILEDILILRLSI